jgi:peptide-methionine (S)-S-oxide reductase
MSEQITLAGGCFWCLDAAYRRVRGIQSSTCGYAGGSTINPTYDEVCTGATGHAEAVQLRFDPKIIILDDILDIFWTIHDPTTLNRQGNDVGTQYRSMIFYGNQVQEKNIEASIKRAQKLWKDPIVTEVVPFKQFFVAEPEHQNYFTNHPEAAYCQVVINPKLQKLQHKFRRLLA